MCVLYVYVFSSVRIVKYGKNQLILNKTNGNEITNKEFNYIAGNFIMWVMKKGTYGGRMLMCV